MNACAQEIGSDHDRALLIAAARAVQALAAGMRETFTAAQKAADGFPKDDRIIAPQLWPSVHRAELFASQMLAYAGAQSLAPARLELLPFLSDLGNSLFQTLDMRVRVFVDVGHDCPLCFADGEALRDALLNLVINARDAMRDGGRIQLSANAATADDGSPAVAISVADDGVGMAADLAGRAMLPFVTTKTNDPKAGMGLAATDGFARQSGGRLELSCRQGGVTATLILPQSASEGLRQGPGDMANA
ncbi:ATP-binding protein [Variovorax ginsengisoli]|uniref:histidine kinase n=1 Tax=Variovorax ginsengisoli TaxID=363844 RepID=A0ABT8RXP0_9BURK|nr:ATP-binding protein [Variovorax ginsengisoli]MDN8611592.1 ATP-binding protein [Variovorax ginsengisoli]MDO1530762.1 ATP-binding protein [Variovorax ginsengisoli]